MAQPPKQPDKIAAQRVKPGEPKMSHKQAEMLAAAARKQLARLRKNG